MMERVQVRRLADLPCKDIHNVESSRVVGLQGKASLLHIQTASCTLKREIDQSASWTITRICMLT